MREVTWSINCTVDKLPVEMCGSAAGKEFEGDGFGAEEEEEAVVAVVVRAGMTAGGPASATQLGQVWHRGAEGAAILGAMLLSRLEKSDVNL